MARRKAAVSGMNQLREPLEMPRTTAPQAVQAEAVDRAAKFLATATTTAPEQIPLIL